MIFQTVWFSDMVLSVSWIVLILILAASAPSAFRSLARYRSALPLCTVIFSAAWCLNASAGGGQLAQMNYHLLAVNLVALMVGTSAAFWLAALLMLPYCLLFAGSAGAYPPNALVLILPALAVNRLSRMLVNRLPPNIFIFNFRQRLSRFRHRHSVDRAGADRYFGCCKRFSVRNIVDDRPARLYSAGVGGSLPQRHFNCHICCTEAPLD